MINVQIKLMDVNHAALMVKYVLNVTKQTIVTQVQMEKHVSVLNFTSKTLILNFVQNVTNMKNVKNVRIQILATYVMLKMNGN